MYATNSTFRFHAMFHGLSALRFSLCLHTISHCFTPLRIVLHHVVQASAHTHCVLHAVCRHARLCCTATKCRQLEASFRYR